MSSTARHWLRAVAAALIVILGVRPARADSTQDNLDKYYRLRDRLVTEFTSVGPDPGQSEPAPERMESIARMKWGDETIALGFYLGVLASEHYLLTHPGTFPGAEHGDPNRLDATRDELYYALRALERLDNSADAAFPSPCTTTPALNGFFLRDDVPADFYTRFPGITSLESDFIDPTLTNKEESQDQVWHVQHGLALVVALVPADVVVQGKPLRAWAIEQARRITQHFAHDDWIIRNPACGNRPVNRGENAIGYSYGETLAASYVTDGTFNPTTDPFWMGIWDTLRSPTNPAYSNENNLHMALAIMAVGDGYGADTPAVMATLADTQDWPVYPLLHRVLHPVSPGFCTTAPAVNARARLMLDELPGNPDPACPGPGGPASHGFTTHNRFIRGKSQAYVGPEGCDNIHYHGLDYMLLHNLYAIATPGTWNGSPDADPCAVLPGDPDAAIPGGADADPAAPDAGPTTGGDDDMAGGCCDLGSRRGAPSAIPMALAVLWSLRRRRHARSTSAS
jgi:hypothetical protein